MKKSSLEMLLEENVSRTILSVLPQDSVTKAAKVMTDAGVGLVLVVVDKRLVGVLSERDIVGKWVCSPKFPAEMKVEDIMTKNVEVVTPEDTVFDCYLRFSARKCRHLPVVDSFGSVLGVLSMRDVAGYVIHKLEELSVVEK